MKEVNTIKKVSVSFDELLSFASVPTNRCGYLNEVEALNNGFSQVEWDRFISRAKKLKKTIIEKGFSKASFFVLAQDEKGVIYILDGQGRRKALQMISEKKYMGNMEFICDMYVNPMSISDMSNLIKDMNTGNTNWQSKDIRRSDALCSDNEDVKTAWEYTKKMAEKYELTDYTINLLTFGEKASQQRTKGLKLTTKDYATTKEIFTNAYINVIENLSNTFNYKGDVIPHNKEVRKKIRNTNFAISFVSCLRSIVKIHDGDIQESENDIEYFVNKIIEAGSGDGNYVSQFVKCEKKDKHIVADKVRKYCKKITIVNALYKTNNNGY
jgi:hypothetical protein